eukprot:CAMPEP_0206038138 /NCGR_PEP_ID=MMETSP1466-20131121/3918_1 /ASSEMBLY_ACC=CAM_ASM_001126 /TAXON_ID=44452 /ORGANISM="Pavlova gyrans, Strain CCMP608" /LENGTH=85 /DNA_ID=CAMNT_0053412727 /DNA_START=32 /DNA_END=286 /DNA_ORIENTATION=-
MATELGIEPSRILVESVESIDGGVEVVFRVTTNTAAGEVSTNVVDSLTPGATETSPLTVRDLSEILGAPVLGLPAAYEPPFSPPP